MSESRQRMSINFQQLEQVTLIKTPGHLAGRFLIHHTELDATNCFVRYRQVLFLNTVIEGDG